MILEAPESWRVLAGTTPCALFLDVDGALLELAESPADVVASEDVVLLLRRLHERLEGAVALLSGRSIDDLDRIFAPLRLPCAGIHGCERRTTDGSRLTHPVDTDFLEHARRSLREFVEWNDGTMLEHKGLSIAVHTRASKGAQAEAAAAVSALAAESKGRFVLQRGKEVFELKPSHADKGRALAEFMAEAPYQRRRPVAVGDDLTDADAFAEAERRGGVSVSVGNDAPRAMVRLDSPSHLRQWLRDWAW